MGIQTASQAYTNEGLGGFSFRNKIINGDMRINQRYSGTTLSASGTGGGMFFDRWSYYTSGQTITFSQGTLTSSDTPYAYGFRNTYKGTVAATTSASAYWMSQVIEGYNIADLAWGTAFAKPITVSFWAKSSLTGNVPLAIKNTYTGATATYATPISVSPTWTYYTVTIPGPTSGSWGSSNDFGLSLQFTLSGGNASPTPSTWVYDNYYGLTGQLDFGANLNSTFEITGVQLEKGSTATPFEFRSAAAEMQLCQRYYTLIGREQAYTPFAPMGVSYTATNALLAIVLPVKMRTTPDYSVSIPGAEVVEWTTATNYPVTSYSTPTGQYGSQSFLVNVVIGTSSLTAGRVTSLRAASNASAYIAFTAELA